MSFKNKEVQPELFCSLKKHQHGNILTKNFLGHSASSVSCSCDTVVVIVIAVLMLNVSVFVLGIERGKVLVSRAAEKPAPLKAAVSAVTSEPVPAMTTVSVPEPTALPPVSTSVQEIIIADAKPAGSEPRLKTTGYSIQLVTYSSNSVAQKEIDKLSTEGHDGFIRKSGEYYVVYTGLYDSKDSAAHKLRVFKKRYKDCFVKYVKDS